MTRSPIAGRPEHNFRGDHAFFENSLIVVDIVDEQIECLDSLLEPGLKLTPLTSRQDSRHDVKRKYLSAPCESP